MNYVQTVMVKHAHWSCQKSLTQQFVLDNTEFSKQLILMFATLGSLSCNVL